MKNLSTAIYTQAAASTAFMALIGSRFYKGNAPTGAVYPYVVYSMIYDNTANTFTDELEDCLFQFSIFSADNSSTAVENIFTSLKGVFDQCTLTVTGNTFLHMLRQQATLFQDELPNPNGTGWVWHYAVDYNIMIQKN